MQKIITSTVLTVALVISLLFSPNTTYAQNMDTPQYNIGAGTTQNTVDNSDNGFDWRWLLPLAAIPILFLLFRGDDSRDTEYREETRLAGRKGGRSDQYYDEEE
jgi:hypothetical protein